jgi:Fic family protein
MSEEQSGDVLRLRKLNRILSIHASTAIEGNKLTLEQVTDVIENSLYKYVDLATETMKSKGKGRKTIADVPVNVPVNVPIYVPINVPINPLAEKVCILLRANPKATIEKLALTLGVTDRTIKRALKSLQEAGIIERVGARKTGHWEIIHPSVENR